MERDSDASRVGLRSHSEWDASHLNLVSKEKGADLKVGEHFELVTTPVVKSARAQLYRAASLVMSGTKYTNA